MEKLVECYAHVLSAINLIMSKERTTDPKVFKRVGSFVNSKSRLNSKEREMWMVLLWIPISDLWETFSRYGEVKDMFIKFQRPKSYTFAEEWKLDDIASRRMAEMPGYWRVKTLVESWKACLDGSALGLHLTRSPVKFYWWQPKVMIWIRKEQRLGLWLHYLVRWKRHMKHNGSIGRRSGGFVQ